MLVEITAAEKSFGPCVNGERRYSPEYITEPLPSLTR